jgi:hypothetical protein
MITGLLADAGLPVITAEVTGQHTTTAERAAWLSIPVFAHPEGALSYEQKTAILAEDTAQTKADDVAVTSWLVIVAELPEEAWPIALAPVPSTTACSLPVSRPPRDFPVAPGSPDSVRCGDRPRDPGPDEALRQIQRVPGGPVTSDSWIRPTSASSVATA